MKLLTKEIEKKLPGLSDELGSDPIAQVHYFNPTGIGNWFGMAYDPDSRIMFGYVSLFGDHNDELGDFSLIELEEFKGMFGLGIERDLHWKPTPLSQIKAEYTK
jgi:hypothetical protein